MVSIEILKWYAFLTSLAVAEGKGDLEDIDPEAPTL